MSYKLQLSGNVPIVIDTITPSTNAFPSAVAFGGQVYVLFSGHDPTGNPSVWQIAWNPSAGWTGNNQVTFPGNASPQTVCAPATAVLGNTLYLAWANFNTETIMVASATAGDGPIQATDWTPLAVTGGTGPNNCDSGLVMVAYPYQNADALWFFYMNGVYLAYAIAQPNANGIEWLVNEGSLQTGNGVPMGNACPAATVAPLTDGGDAVPYVVFVGTGSGGDLSYVDWNGSGFDGNEHLSLPPSHFVEQTPQSNRPPCLISLPDQTVSMMLFYKGRHTNDLMLSVYAKEEWQLNMEMAKIPGAGGKPVTPQTDIGVSAALYDANSIVVVYPSSQSGDGQDLWVTMIDFVASS